LGLERAGMACQWQVEIDPFCQKVLAKHWPDVRRYGDVRTVGRHNLEPVDLICGGFPCQDVSVAGKRQGLAGERSGLWYEFHRVLEELRPQWVVIENVPGLLSSNGGGGFAIILQGLAEIGYLSAWRVLDSQYYRVAQRRRRVFIVGSLGDGRAAEVLFEPESLSWDTPPRRQAGKGVTAPIKASSPSRRGKGPMWNYRKTYSVRSVIDQYIGEIYPTLRGQPNQGPGRMVDDAAAAGMVRRLTPTECERLQGFPDGWTAVNEQKDTARYRQLGNAVSVPVAEWIGRHILAI